MGVGCAKIRIAPALQNEIQRHDLSSLVDEPSSVAQGGQGVGVPGPCGPARFGTIGQFIDHLTKDVLPAIINKVSVDRAQEKSGSVARPGCPSFSMLKILLFGTMR
jgi:hypothetical protein